MWALRLIKEVAQGSLSSLAAFRPRHDSYGARQPTRLEEPQGQSAGPALLGTERGHKRAVWPFDQGNVTQGSLSSLAAFRPRHDSYGARQPTRLEEPQGQSAGPALLGTERAIKAQ